MEIADPIVLAKIIPPLRVTVNYVGYYTLDDKTYLIISYEDDFKEIAMTDYVHNFLLDKYIEEHDNTIWLLPKQLWQKAIMSPKVIDEVNIAYFKTFAYVVYDIIDKENPNLTEDETEILNNVKVLLNL